MVALRLTTQLQNTISSPLTEHLSIVSESARQDLPDPLIESSIETQQNFFFSTLGFQKNYDGYFDLPDISVAGNFDSYDVI